MERGKRLGGEEAQCCLWLPLSFCTGGFLIIHLFRKLLEFYHHPLCRTPLGEYAGILVSIKMAVLNEALPTITPSLCHTVMLLADMSVAVVFNR